ncbi:MAG: substrate-binding domain-containing protein [Methanomicrobiales archaeon]|nr:substrate-binding domain-containing protein [Methanomicrobiales archaeon]
MMKPKIVFLLLACLVTALLVSGCVQQKAALRIATTTSLYDTGLLEEIERAYEEKTGTDLLITSQGSGKAIELARRGDVDLLLIHSPPEETAFMSAEDGLYHRCFAYNYFLLLGPPEDPADIKNLTAIGAFARLHQLGRSGNPDVRFVSRGDLSGTHHAEIRIWRSAGFNYTSDVQGSGRWYIETGKGMGESLQVANEKDAYILADTGTYLAFRSKLRLVPVIASDEELLNRYSAIVINPGRHQGTNDEDAKEFVNWLLSEEGKEILTSFGGDAYGAPLFTPLEEGICESEPFSCTCSLIP